MRNLLATFGFMVTTSAIATDHNLVDVARDAAIILDFQSAVATYDENKAMSFVAPEAELIFKVGENPSQKYSGIDQIREAYAKYWFNVPSKMLDLEEANFSCVHANKFKYVFKGDIAEKKEDGWKVSRRESVSFFTIENGKIVKIERFQKAAQN